MPLPVLFLRFFDDRGRPSAFLALIWVVGIAPVSRKGFLGGLQGSCIRSYAVVRLPLCSFEGRV